MSNIIDFQIFKQYGERISPDGYAIATGQIIDEANRSVHFKGVLLKDVPALIIERAKQLNKGE